MFWPYRNKFNRISHSKACCDWIWLLNFFLPSKILSQMWHWSLVSSWTALWALIFSALVKDLPREWQTNAIISSNNGEIRLSIQKIFPTKKKMCDRKWKYTWLSILRSQVLVSNLKVKIYLEKTIAGWQFSDPKYWYWICLKVADHSVPTVLALRTHSSILAFWDFFMY